MVAGTDVYTYMRSAIVTNEVKVAGSGIYKVGKVPAYLDISDRTSHMSGCAGWTLAVIYRYLLSGHPFKSITFYAGSLPVVQYQPPAVTTLQDFVTPNYDAITARLLLSAAEGDYNLLDDQVFFGTAGNPNIDIALFGPNNPEGNFFASQINDNSGNLNTTGTFGTLNHYRTTPTSNTFVGVTAGRQGWDITNIDGSLDTGIFIIVNTGDTPLPIEDDSTVRVDCVKATLDKVADKEFVEAGGEIKYTITFTNNSSVDMYDVKIADTIPTQTSLIAGSIIPAPQVGESLTTGVTIGNVPKGTSKTLEFRVTVNASATGTITNTASAVYKFKDWKNIEHTGSPDPDTATVTCVEASLTIVKSANKTYVTATDKDVEYTLIITNTGDVKVKDIIVTDPIPAGMAYKANSTLRNNTLPYTNENPASGISIGDLNPGASYKLQFTFTVL